MSIRPFDIGRRVGAAATPFPGAARTWATLALAAVLAAGCESDPTAPELGSGRLHVQHVPATGPTQAGTRTLILENGETGLLHIPTGYDVAEPTPLAILLHAEEGTAESFRGFFELADEHGIAIFAPTSTATTWDLSAFDAYGRDIEVLAAALPEVFAIVNVDPARLAIGGFADGASYALSLGLANGDLFSHVIAFTPGYVMTDEQFGQPEFFISHGTMDLYMPIAQSSRPIVEGLRAAGYSVVYEEFDGPHRIPDEISNQAFAWLAGAVEGE